MSRFSGLPDPRANTANRSARFTKLMEALQKARISSHASYAQGSDARLRSLAVRTPGAALGATKVATPSVPAPTPSPVAKRAPVAAAKPVATTPPPQPWKVPADIAAKGANAEAGYRILFEAVSDQLARMSKIPAAQGRIASLIEMVASGSSDADVRAGLANMPTDKQRQISASWDQAVAAVYHTRGIKLASAVDASGPTPRDAARKRMLSVASSSLFVGNEVSALKFLTMRGCFSADADDLLDTLATVTGSAKSSEGVWDRALAAVLGTKPSAKPDPYGWQAIHADVRERRR
ncbi:MAG: hypothetical protein J0H88_13835 [Sphingomonadales bacterium]|nr:hypothetical protein [Sphingomonadales bacterium]